MARDPRPARGRRALALGALVLWLAAGRVWSADPAALFSDVTDGSGLRFRHVQGDASLYLPEIVGAGAALIDYDGDGFEDVFLVQGSGEDDEDDPARMPRSRLFRNLSGRRFVDVTDAAGLDCRGWGMGCLAADLDNDGYVDLAVTFYDAPPRLFRNNGDGTFQDLGAAALGGRHPWTTGLCALDLDRDGLLDLYVCGYQEYGPERFVDDPPLVPIQLVLQPLTLSPHLGRPLPGRMLRNLGWRFEDVTGPTGTADPGGKSLSAVAADFDGDGWTDLFIANDVSPCTLFRNLGDGRFEDVSRSAWVADSRGSMGVAASDADGDGRIDIVVARWVEEWTAFYHNETRTGSRRLAFVDRAERAGLAKVPSRYVGWGIGFVDLDNAGRADLVIVNGHTFHDPSRPGRLVPQEMVVLDNDGPGRFTRRSVPAKDAAAVPRVGRGAAFGDLDRDGWTDLVVTANNGPAALLVRERGTNRWLDVELSGTLSNRDASGAVVALETPGRCQTRPAGAGGSYLSSGSRLVHFGLGAARGAARLRIRWPGGQESRVEVGESVRFIRLREPRPRGR